MSPPPPTTVPHFSVNLTFGFAENFNVNQKSDAYFSPREERIYVVLKRKNRKRKKEKNTVIKQRLRLELKAELKSMAEITLGGHFS